MNIEVNQMLKLENIVGLLMTAEGGVGKGKII